MPILVTVIAVGKSSPEPPTYTHRGITTISLENETTKASAPPPGTDGYGAFVLKSVE